MLATYGQYCKYHNPAAYLKIETKPPKPDTLERIDNIDQMVDVLSRAIALQSSKTNMSAKEVQALSSLAKTWLKATEEKTKQQILKPTLEQLNRLKQK